MIIASCHCQAVRIQIPRPPAYLNECQCSICRRYGARWGYYHPDEVQVLNAPGTTDFYQWGDKIIEFHRCRNCGCVTHWQPVDRAETRMGINGRLLDQTDLAGVPVQQSPGPP